MNATETLPTADELRAHLAREPALARHHARLPAPRTWCACAARIAVEHSIARLTAEKLWRYLNEKPFVNALGALTGNQAMQQVKAGLDAIYLSGWQVAGDANLAGADVPGSVALPGRLGAGGGARASTTRCAAPMRSITPRATTAIDWLKPIVADAEAGFGGVLNAFELMKQMIEAGAAGVHFEDQLSSAKKCGHMGGKVLVPTQEAINKLVAARLAADVCNVPTRARGAHRCRGRERCSPRTSTSATGRSSMRAQGAHRRRASSTCKAGLRAGDRARPAPTRPTPTWCGARPASPISRRRAQFAEGIHRQFPGQAARLQLLAVVQLEAQARRRDHRQVPARARRHGLPVPVHHAGRLPRAQLLDVRAGARLQGAADDRLRGAAAGGVRRRSAPATRPPSTSARWAPATSTRSRRRSAAAPPRSPRSPAAPRSSSSARPDQARACWLEAPHSRYGTGDER